MNLRDGEAYFQMGKSSRGQGRLAEAEAALRQSLELDPQNGGARFELGVLYQDQNRLIEAATEFERAIAIDPRMVGAHGQLGRIYRRQGRPSEAEAALNKALELDPQDGCARFELGVLYEGQSKSLEAAAEFERAIAIDPSHGGAHFQLARIYRRQGRVSEAAAEFERAVVMDPNHGGAHGQLGRIYRRQGRTSEAEELLSKALKLDPQDGCARFELGALYEDQGKFIEAAAEFQKALDINPQDSGAHLHLGEIHGRHGRRLEAAAEFEKAIVSDPKNSDAYFYLGHVHLRRGLWPKAAAAFQMFLELNPRSAGGYIGLWASCRGQGRRAEAEAALAKAVAIDPKSVFSCTKLLERLDRDNAVGNGAEEPMRERVACLLPWTHLNIFTDGTSRPCPMWSGPPLGNARASSVDDLWNSPGMKALRSDMMNGRPVAGCWRCHELERSGFWSMRQRKNIELDRYRGRMRLTAPDGALPWLPVPLLDIRFSNICGLRCRTCDPTHSSAWRPDARAMGWSDDGGGIRRCYDDWDTLWRQLQRLLEEGLEEILFVGGEPLLMEEHYRVLDFLIARKRTDVRLNYMTNFSTLRFQDRDVIDLWSRFRDVQVTASLDGSGRRGEYIRKGLRWEAVVANREEMLRRCPDVAFSIAVTLSVFNALHLPNFHREWVEKGFINCDALALNMVLTPEIYRTQVLPTRLKQQVLESYQRHRESFLDADGIPALDFAAAARFMEAQDRSELLPEFLAVTRCLDHLRGEDCREVFPELAPLFEAAG